MITLYVSSHKCSSSGGYIVYMQHMVLSICNQGSGRVLLKHVLVILDNSPVYRVTVPYAAFIQCILLKMRIYGSKHAEE